MLQGCLLPSEAVQLATLETHLLTKLIEPVCRAQSAELDRSGDAP